MPLRDSDNRLFALATSPRAVIGCGVILALTMLSICAIILYGGRQDALEHASDASRNTLLVIERDIERNIELYDLSLQAVIDGINRQDVIVLPARVKRELLFDRAATAKYLGTIVATDAAGNIILDSRNDLPPPKMWRIKIISRFNAITRPGACTSVRHMRPGCSMVTWF